MICPECRSELKARVLRGVVEADACEACSLRPICGGLFDQGGAYDPAELHPVFVDHEEIVAAVLGDLKPHESAISGNFLNRSVLKAPPGLEDGDALPRFRWKLRSESEGFDYAMLLGE